MLKKFFNENFITVFCAAALAFVVGGFTWAFFELRATGTNSLILHFNSVQGITTVGGLGLIIFMGVFATLIVFMNFAIAREFSTRDQFFGRFLAVLTLAFAILLFIAFAAIIRVNV